MSKPRVSRILAAVTAAGWLGFGAMAWAGIPEPDAIYYGNLSLDGMPQDALSGRTVELRRGIEVIARYTMGDSPAAGNLYVLRVSLEAARGGPATPGTARVGEQAAVWVLTAGGELEAGIVYIGSRGPLVRVDIDARTDPAATDSDADGVPDFRDNCINPAAGSSQIDSDGNGIGDACEGVVNPFPPYASVLDVDNAADPATGKGSVGYAYQISSHEVTNADYVEFLNKVADEDPGRLYSDLMTTDPRGGIVRSGSAGSYAYAVKPRMADKPVNYVSWLDAARYANWLANERPAAPQGPGVTESGAFDLLVSAPELNARLDEAADHSLPTEDEWYKSAYYDPTRGGSGYWVYPTREDTAPFAATANSVGDVSNPTQNPANYRSGARWNGLVGNVTTVGSAQAPSFYGTDDQGGNVVEWLGNDSEADGAALKRVLRGGSYEADAQALESTADFPDRVAVLGDPTQESPTVGFRVVRFVNELEGICGDLTGNGLVNTADVSLFRRFLAGTSVLSPTAESRCTAIGPLGPCDLLDLVVIRRALAVPPLGPGIAGSCDALAGL